MIFLPNSRFMNELAVICPTYPLAPFLVVKHKSKNRSAKGTASEYCLMAGAVSLSISSVQSTVTHDDVRWIADDNVILLVRELTR